jgi:dual specificity tyrosine-phosphorylation-regulated kinase 2/3/4
LILVELFTGFPLLPGENEKDQLSLMQELLGPPTEKMLGRAKRKSYFTDDNGDMIPYKPPKGKPRVVGSKPIESVVKTDDKKFLDFLHGCICWDPNERMTPT